MPLLLIANSSLRFSHLTTDNGLSQSNVTCIAQDKSGFMWFGTFNGLNRYDGYEFKTYHYSEREDLGLAHNFISDLAIDTSGNIWVATGDGLNRIDPQTDKVGSFRYSPDKPSDLPDGQIETMLVDSRNRVWIGTRNGGLAFYEKTRGFQTLNPDLQSTTISLLYEDKNENIWVIHDNGAIDLLNGSTLKPFHLISERELSPHRISAITQSKDGHFWIASQGGGLFHAVFENNNFKIIDHYTTQHANTPLNSNIILSLLFDREGLLWIGYEDNGIDLFDISQTSITHVTHDPYNKYSISHNSIWSIFEDMAGNIWVGTYAYGVNLLIDRNSLFEHYRHRQGDPNSLSHNMVNAFWESQDSNLWIATDGGGLNYFDRNKDAFIHYNTANSDLKTDVILTLHEDPAGNLWLGTWAEGLYLFNDESGQFINYNERNCGLASNRILDIEDDGGDGLWIATFWRGLTYFNPTSHEVKIFNAENSNLSDNNVRVVLRDSKGIIWVGTDAGLDRFFPSTKTFVNYVYDENDPGSISKGFVLSIAETEDGKIWVGTSGGLNLFDPDSNNFSRFGVIDGLPDNEIKCILECETDALWLSTNNGICCFNPLSGDVQLFDHSDGLQGNEFNVRSGLKMSSGEIVFGGNNGFNLFKPSSISSNTYVPPVLITDLKLFNHSVTPGSADSILAKDIAYTDEIVLRYNQDVFSFDFTALNYISSQDNQYAYKLEGFESDWNYVGNVRSAGYTNIDPGHYIFRVKASNNDGVWNETGASLNIEITPPFWQTWWAYIIETLIILAVIYSIIQFFISRQKMRSDLRLEQLELEKMYELDQMKTRFINNISHEFHAPMTLILSPLEKLNGSASLDNKAKESVSMILRNAQRMQRMVGQLKDVQKLETGELALQLSTGNIIAFLQETVNSFKEYAIDHHMNFTFSSSTDREIVWFDGDKLDKILYNLLSNAFKFTKDFGSVHVVVQIKDASPDSLDIRNIEISVSDTGIGIPKDKIDLVSQRYYRIRSGDAFSPSGSGLGLALVSELINLYHGKIRVESIEGQGSTFTINIPLDEKYLEENQLVGEFIRNSAEKVEPFTLMDIETPSEEESKGLIPGDTPLILVVEDDDEIRKYIKLSLDPEYRVKCAENGEIGLDLAKKHIPDMVISDIKMPVMDGIELCNRLKESEKTSHIPVILLTAYSSKQSKIEGLSKGADAYLAKPFNIDMLNAQIVNLLSSRKKLRKKFSTDFLVGPQSKNLKDVDERFLQRLVEVIEKNISDTGLNADTLGKKVGMSRTQLYRKIRGLTDQTVSEFIKQIRLKRAAQLLSEKRVTITEVAYAVGFNDLTYFARCFKKQYQKSPSEYISPLRRK